MDNKHLAHDLAIAKLCGKDFPPEKFIEQYRQYYDEFLKLLQADDHSPETNVINTMF